MTNYYSSYARPALWGFFVCMALAGFLFIVRLIVPLFINYRWDAERTKQHKLAEEVIRNEFQNRIDQLEITTERVSKEIALNIKSPSTTIKTFSILNSCKLNDNQTIDIIDTQGNVLAWNGESISSLYKQKFNQNSTELFVYVIQNGLCTYLTVSKKLNDSLFLLVSEPFEVNPPISNRFIRKVSLSEELGQKLGTQVTLKLSQSHVPHKGEYSVPIINKANGTIAEFFVKELTLDIKISSTIETCEILVALFLAVSCLFFTLAGVLWVAKKRNNWMTATSLIMSLWLLRFVWRELDIPSTLIGGWLFNPNLYASPFIYGLSSSLGELIITVLTVAASSWILLSQTIFKTGTNRIFAINSSRIGRIASIVLVFILSILILWFFRGFAEAVRSFVFDSTIQYSNPSEILPNVTAALMYFNIIMLGVSVLCVSTVFLYTGRKLLSINYSQAKNDTPIFICSVITSIPVFAFLDETQLVPLICSIVFITICIIFVELFFVWKGANVNSTSRQWKLALWMTLSSFVIGAPLLHRELQLREHKEIEAVGNEFLRPSDSWLSYIVQDGLRTSSEGVKDILNTQSLISAKDNNLAFVLWTKTLIGKEGYNSSLILYDQQGIEVDRFVIGMNKPEQQIILTKVFSGEEEAIHVVDRTDQKTIGKQYGAWTTVRDSSGHLIGSIALLLSEHQKTIFHEESTEPFRQFGDRLQDNSVREIAVHEFINDSLVFSTGRKLYPDYLLSAKIDSDFLNTKNSFLWKNLSINGYKTQTVFMKDPALPIRIAAISLEELDFRWDMFAYLKEFFVCLAILAAIGVGPFVRKRKQNSSLVFGFRGKLLLGFACITLVPLVVLSYYNRQLVIEQVQKQGEIGLYNELAKLQNRISGYISDEEDFDKGVNDDLCEAIAAEYGIDFSIYRDAKIHASSRSELYRASLLDKRLNGTVYGSTMLDKRTNVLAKEKIGSVEYLVGYAPLLINEKIVGVIAIPTLNRQKEVEAELSQQNVNVFGVYAIVFGIALVGSGLLATRYARPLQKLTHAVKNVGEGKLDSNVFVKSHDEIGTLAQSFNDMIMNLRISREELAKHERESAWKEMAKQVAHEIKNPLTPMKLSIQHLRQAFRDKAPDREEILQRVSQTVIDQVEALSRIATEFSHFAKMPERKYERVSIDHLLKETINLFKEIQGITFIDQLTSPTVEVIADNDQLRGAFINIIRNAIQAIEKTGTITITTLKEERVCLVIISDTGLGIPEEIRSKIFEPNFSTKSEGMGIGLAIARKVIEDHGGNITCKSELGKGTTFEIRLPI